MKFSELLDELGVESRTEGHHHCRSGWLQLDCPKCSPNSKSFRLGYNLAYKYLNCWVCGRLNVIEVLRELTGKSWSKCKSLLDDVEAETAGPLPIAKRGKLVVPKGVNKLLVAHRLYLSKRGFDPDELVRLWEIGGIGVAARLSWRVYIPFIHNGQVVSWTTRKLTNEGTRYISAKPEEEIFPTSDLLYGEDYCRTSIVVHEGPIDVWATGPGAVATTGLKFSSKQIARILKYPVRVVCFDNEPKAQRRARELADILSSYPGDTYNVCLSGKDAASSPKKEIKRLRRQFIDCFSMGD